jgi:AraC-like DNA-binding protein
MTNKARKVRGINVILDASKRKKELPPIQFAKNWNGELQRIGFRAVWRHCQRYSTAFSIEDTRDAIAEVIADLWERGKLEASLKQNKLDLSREEKIQFCRDVVNAYRRYLHEGKKSQAHLTLDVILGMDDFYQWRPSDPEAELRWIELKESLRQTLSRTDYAACQLILQGYSRDEVAGMLKMARRTLRRRFDRLPAGKLLKILRT